MNRKREKTSSVHDAIISYGAAAVGAVVLLAVAGTWVYRGATENPMSMLCIAGIAFLLLTFTFWRKIGVTWSKEKGLSAQFEAFEQQVEDVKEEAISEINSKIIDIEKAVEIAKTALGQLTDTVQRANAEQTELKEKIPAIETATMEAISNTERLKEETEANFKNIGQKIEQSVEAIVAQQMRGVLIGAEKEENTPVIKLAAAMDTVSVLILAAWDFFSDGKYDDAVILASKAIDNDERSADAYFVRGSAYQKLDGQFENAVSDLNKAVELNPENVHYHLIRGIAYSEQENYAMAVVDFSKMIELEPKNINAHLLRGITCFLQEKYTKAKADFSKVIELDPENVDVYFARGIVNKKLNEPAKAEADYRKHEELTRSSNSSGEN